MATVDAWPLSLCASFAEGGYTSLHRRLENVVAAFLRKDDAVIFNMVRWGGATCEFAEALSRSYPR